MSVPEVFCPSCTPASAVYRNGVCDPSTAKSFDVRMNISESSNGFEPDEESSIVLRSEESSRRQRRKRVRLPETNVPGESPHTTLTPDEVDDVARETILEARKTKCDGIDEWCPENIGSEDAVGEDPERMLDKKVKRQLIREEMMDLRRLFSDMKKQGIKV